MKDVIANNSEPGMSNKRKGRMKTYQKRQSKLAKLLHAKKTTVNKKGEDLYELVVWWQPTGISKYSDISAPELRAIRRVIKSRLEFNAFEHMILRLYETKERDDWRFVITVVLAHKLEVQIKEILSKPASL